MALKLDNNLIEELGLGALPEQEKQLLLRQIYEKLEMNVGVRLADQMSNEQLDEFEKFVDANDDKGAFQWLESNFPNYKDVVNQEFEKLKTEIKQYAPQMLAVAQHNSQQAAGAAAQQSGVPGQNGPMQQPGQPQYQPAPQQQYPQNPAAQPIGYPQQPGPSGLPQYQQPPQQPYGQPQGPQPGQAYYGGSQQSPYGQPGQVQYPQQPGQYGQYPQNQPGQQQYPQYPPQQPPAGPAQQ